MPLGPSGIPTKRRPAKPKVKTTIKMKR
jgi:hypothetical protein